MIAELTFDTCADQVRFDLYLRQAIAATYDCKTYEYKHHNTCACKLSKIRASQTGELWTCERFSTLVSKVIVKLWIDVCGIEDNIRVALLCGEASDTRLWTELD